MRQITLVLMLVISWSVAVSAQTASTKATPSANEPGHSYGYVFAAPGGTSGGGGGTLHIGGGGEGVFKNGAGIGAELGYVSPFESVRDGLGLFSINGSYHFLKSSRCWSCSCAPPSPTTPSFSTISTSPSSPW